LALVLAVSGACQFAGCGETRVPQAAVGAARDAPAATDVTHPAVPAGLRTELRAVGLESRIPAPLRRRCESLASMREQLTAVGRSEPAATSRTTIDGRSVQRFRMPPFREAPLIA
jgi:hypothetical protein